MGIFNKIDKVQNYLVDSPAGLSVTPENYVNNGNEAFRFNIVCEVKDADVKINKIYLKVKGLETVTILNVQLAQQKDLELDTEKKSFSSSHQTFCEKFRIVEPQVLGANQTYKWMVEVDLPREVAPTYQGYNAKHEWKAYAGLDTDGEDPISDWVTFEIRK